MITQSPRRINIDDLHKAVSTFPTDIRNDDGGRATALANTVIAHFLGRDWFEAHIPPNSRKPSFLRMDFSSDRRGKVTFFRVLELAESLFNLRNIDGFDACIKQMKGGGEKIESTLAELDLGRLLYINDVQFRFVVPQMTKSKDYDVEILYTDGRVVPADAKCKFETTEINPHGIVNSLTKARKQLPEGRPCIIFMKVPQSWVDDIKTAVAMEDAGRKFLRTTDRILAITFYVSYLEIRDDGLMHSHALREITNESSCFHGGLNWELFTNYFVPSSWNGMPPKWQRLLFFPDQKPGDW